MASIYACTGCNADLNLQTLHLYPPDFYFEAGNKDSLSFAAVDQTKVIFEKEDKLTPFFETVNYWGIHRKRTKMLCASCRFLVGHVYDDGPPDMAGNGQLGMGPSQVIPRDPRYRFMIKALKITTET